MKRTLCAFLAVLMLFSMVPMYAAATETEECEELFTLTPVENPEAPAEAPAPIEIPTEIIESEAIVGATQGENPAAPAELPAEISEISGTMTTDVGDYLVYDKEPNNARSTSQRIYHDTTVYGSISSSDRHDWYKLVLNDRAQIYLVGISDTQPTMYVICDSELYELDAGYNMGYSNGYYRDYNLITLDAGTYYITPYNTSAYSDTYMFYIEVTSKHTCSYDKVTITTYPTRYATGTRTKTCSCGKYVTETIPCLTPAEKPYKIANVVSGVHVYWNAVDGAQKYGLWRSENGKNGTYKWIANPTVAHFTDTKVTSGKTYFYKVTTLDTSDNSHSVMSDPIGVTYVSTPDITKRNNIASGVKLEWEKITGATGYAIYRKSYYGDDAWVRVGTIPGNSTFTWTDTEVKNKNGEVYKYTIRALAGSDMKTLSGCRNAGRTMARLSSQTMKSASRTAAGSVMCNWTTSGAVTGYEVRFTDVYGNVKTYTVGNYKTGKKAVTGLKSGREYTVQVRTYKTVDGMGFYSDWSNGLTGKA